MSDAKPSNNVRLYVPIYTVTLILSAFLLFGVQPLFSKMILPRIGGSSSVWNTAMVFFQAVLLGGYLYAHISSKFLSLRFQAILHLGLFVLFAFILPLSIPDSWSAPGPDENIVFWQLKLMAVTVGGPFFALSGCAPLLQRWFSYTDHPDASNPYFLYAASNLGSMTSLLIYPFIVEPLLTLTNQTFAWAGLYGVLILCIAACAIVVKQPKVLKDDVKTSEENVPPVTNKTRVIWLLLAFIPSSLMLGVTTYITTDIASVPLLWIVPLALYVSTFIFAFARKQIISEKLATYMMGIGIIAIIVIAMTAYNPLKLQSIAIHLIIFFFTALMCHIKLVKTQPHLSHITEFYVFMSLGGVLGGIFNALIAPLIFVYPIEYALVLSLACFVRFYDFTQMKTVQIAKTPLTLLQTWRTSIICIASVAFIVAVSFSLPEASGMRLTCIALVIVSVVIFCYTISILLESRRSFAIIVLMCLLIFPTFRIKHMYSALHISRNYFGVSVVTEDTDNNMTRFMHGTTLHGVQSNDPEYALTPLSYYYENARLTFNMLDEREGPQEIAVLGLGAGTLACYQKNNRHFDFFEIDKDVAGIAKDTSLFTYLSNCGSPYDIILGDGRLEIEKQDDKKYDLIFIDVFSSDNIPVHVVTKEALEIYFSKLKDNGIIVGNISNRYMNMIPSLSASANELGAKVYSVIGKGGFVPGTKIRYAPAVYIAMTKSDEVSNYMIQRKNWSDSSGKASKAWTDDYANIVSAIIDMQIRKHAFAKKQKKAAQTPSQTRNDVIDKALEEAKNPEPITQDTRSQEQ